MNEEVHNLSRRLELNFKDDMAQLYNLKTDVISTKCQLVNIIYKYPIKGMNLVKIKDVIKILKDLEDIQKKKHRTERPPSNNEYANTFEQSYNETLIMVKDYIKEAKEFQEKLKLMKVKAKVDEQTSKEKSLLFLIEDTQ